MEQLLAALEDSDVKAERERVEKLGHEDRVAFPLIARDLRKTYGTGKIANKALSLAVEKNIVFGLLGPVTLLYILDIDFRMALVNQR